MWQFLRELPFRILHVIALGLDWVTSKWIALSEVDDDAPPSKHWVHWISSLPVRIAVWLFGATLWLLTIPVRGWFLSPQNRQSYVKGLPALLAVMTVMVILAGHSYFGERIKKRYSSQTTASISRKESLNGLLLAKRLVSASAEIERTDLYLYGIACANINRPEAAEQVMATIAPDWQIGYSPAHQFRAIALIKALDSKTTDEQLDVLQWHLENAGFRDQEQRLLMWAKLHEARGDNTKTAETLEQLGKINPVYYLTLFELERKQGNTTGAEQALANAADAFVKQVEQRPDDKTVRLRLASVQAKQTRFQDAEKTLLVGISFNQDQDMRSALSELYVTRFDSLADEATFFEKLSPLMLALNLDLNQRDVYIRLVNVFDNNLDSERKKEYQATLERMLVSGFNPTAVHFAIGFLSATDNDQYSTATWHLTQAQALQPGMALAYGNLARALSDTTPPRLNEAELFARQAVSGSIQDPAFYVTLGNILITKGESKATIELLKPILMQFPDSEPLQEVFAKAQKGLAE